MTLASRSPTMRSIFPIYLPFNSRSWTTCFYAFPILPSSYTYKRIGRFFWTVKKLKHLSIFLCKADGIAALDTSKALLHWSSNPMAAQYDFFEEWYSLSLRSWATRRPDDQKTFNLSKISETKSKRHLKTHKQIVKSLKNRTYFLFFLKQSC